MKKNKKERDEERSSDTDMMDSRMLWFLMRHLRRVRQPRVSGALIPLPIYYTLPLEKV